MNETDKTKRNAGLKEPLTSEQRKKGYDVFTDADVGNGASHIERIDSLMMFDSDDEAAEYAEKVDGVKLIHDICFEQGSRDCANYVDTLENRERLYHMIIGNVISKMSVLYKNQLEHHFAVEGVIKAFQPIGITLSDKEILDRPPKDLTYLVDQYFNKRPKAEYHYDKQKVVCGVGDIFRNTNGRDYRVLEKYSDTNMLFMDVDSGAMIVGVGVEFIRKLLKPTEEELKKAKERIDHFCMKEYGESADFSDLSNIPVAFAEEFTDKEDERFADIEARIDLINYALKITVNGETVELYQYNTLDDLIEYELDYLDFDALVSLADEACAVAKGEKEPEINKADICIEWGHGIYLSSIPSEIDFAGLKREYGREPGPNDKGEFDIEIREVLSRTESVKAGFLGEAIDELMDKYKKGEIVLNSDDFKQVDYLELLTLNGNYSKT